MDENVSICPDCGNELVPMGDCDCDYAGLRVKAELSRLRAELAAEREKSADQRRKGAAEALRELAVEQQQWGVWVACSDLLNRADAIENGELVVGERYPPERKQDGTSVCPVTE